VPRELPRGRLARPGGQQRTDAARVREPRQFSREGGRHTLYVNREAQRSSTLPRHTEIPHKIARKTCKDLGVDPP